MWRYPASASACPQARWSGWSAPTAPASRTLVNALAGWSRGRDTVTGKVSLEGQAIDSLAAHQRVARGLTLVPEGKNIFVDLTVDENLGPGASARGHNRPAYLPHSRRVRFLPAPCRTAPPQGRSALGRRAADAGGGPRAARRPARADAGRAFRRPRAAADLRSAVADPATGRSRPAGAAGRAECQGRAEGGRPPLSAGARHGSSAKGRPMSWPQIIVSSKPISGRSLPESAHEYRPADRQRPRARFGLCLYRARLDHPARRRAAGEFRAWPALHAGRLRRPGTR